MLRRRARDRDDHRAAALTRIRAVYYGWWIVGAWVVLNIYWAGTLFYGLTVFFNPVRQSFGWSATLMASVFSLASVLTGLLSPVTGAWFDRSGPRPQMVAACGCAAAGLVALSRTTSLPLFVVCFAVVSVGYSVWTGTGIATAGLWFARRRGLAMGLVVAGSSLGGLLVPVWQAAVSEWGWRSTFLIAGLGMLLIGVSASLVLRHRPSDHGLLPDGDSPPLQPRDQLRSPSIGSPANRTMLSDGAFGFWEAIGTRQFWAISTVASVILAGSTAATVLLLPRLLDAGVGLDLAVGVATSAVLLGALGRPVWGLLADRAAIARLAAVMFAMQALGLLVLAVSPRGVFLAVFAVTYGLTNDVVRILASLLLLRYFGVPAFGKILGAHLIVLIPGRVLGPVIAGAFRDNGYGYGAAFLLFSLASIAMILPMLLVGPPSGRMERAITPGLG